MTPFIALSIFSLREMWLEMNLRQIQKRTCLNILQAHFEMFCIVLLDAHCFPWLIISFLHPTEPKKTLFLLNERHCSSMCLLKFYVILSRLAFRSNLPPLSHRVYCALRNLSLPSGEISRKSLNSAKGHRDTFAHSTSVSRFRAVATSRCMKKALNLLISLRFE